MTRVIKPDPNCPLISQSLLKSGAIHHLTAKYLFNVTLIARKVKKIPLFPDTNSESFKIANELVLKYLQRFNLKYTSDSFQVELNLSNSNSSLPIKRLKLTYSQDPLKNFLKIVEKSKRLKFHDTLVIQELLLKVPTLLDDSTKSHFINILKKAGNFNTTDENVIFKIIQKNSKSNQSNKDETDIKKISHSEPPKQPANLSNSAKNINENSNNNYRNNNNTSSSQKARKSDMTDMNRHSKSRSSSRRSHRNTSSGSFYSSSSREDSKTTRRSITETDSNPSTAVVAQITRADKNAYSCNLVDNESGSDSISESNMMKQVTGDKNNNPTISRSQNKNKANRNRSEGSTVSGYANSTSSYFYEYETISEPEQEVSEESTSSAQSEVGQLKKSGTNIGSRSAKADKVRQKKPTTQVPSSEQLPKNSIMRKIESKEKMSLADQITSFDIGDKDIRDSSSYHHTQPEPSPRVYRLPAPEGYDPKTCRRKSSKSKQSYRNNTSSKTKSNNTNNNNNNQDHKNPQEVMAQISKLQKELEALKSEGESDSYSSDHDDRRTSQLQRALSNAIKESSSAIKRNRNVSSSDDDDENNLRNKQKVPSKTSFGATLLEQKKNAKPIQHHHSRSHQRDNDETSTITTDSTSRSKPKQNNEKDQGKSIVVLKSVDNPSRIRTISEQKKIDKMNDQKSNNNYDKTKETQSIINNEPETYRLPIPPDPFRIDKKLTKETNRQSQNQNQNQKQISRLNQNPSQRTSQSQSQRPNQTQNQKLNQVPTNQKQNQSQSLRPSNQPQQKSQISQNQKKTGKPASSLASSDDELISDSPPPAMKQLWESKNKDKNKNISNNTKTTTNTNNTITSKKDKNKNDGLSKISNQNSSSSLYDAFVEGDKKEKPQNQNQNQIQTQNKAKTQSTKPTQKKETQEPPKKEQPKEQPKKQEETKSTKSNPQPQPQKAENNTKPTISFKQPITETTKASTANAATLAEAIRSSNKQTGTSKYTNHSKTASSMSATKYTNHTKTSTTIDGTDSKQNSNTSKYTSHSKTISTTVSAQDDFDKMSTISTSSKNSTQTKDQSLSMRTMQPKSRQENRSVEQKKLGMSQRYFNLNKNIELSSGASQSESFRIPLQKTRLFRARMLSDLSEADFDDSSSSSISERRRLPPLKVQIPYHDGHAKAFQKYYDILSSSENFDLDKENGPIKKKIKEKLLKRSSSVIPNAAIPKRSYTSTAASRETAADGNLALKRASTAGQVSNARDQINPETNNTGGGEDLKTRKERLNNGNGLKVDIQPVKAKIEANNVEKSTNRSGSENSKPTTAQQLASNSGNFVAHLTVVESEKLSRVDTYFVLYIDGSNQAKRTRTVKGKTSSKEFNEDFDFNITREKCNLIIQAKKDDLINGDQLISSAKLSLITLPLHKRHDKWVPLTTFGRMRLVMTMEKAPSSSTTATKTSTTTTAASTKTTTSTTTSKTTTTSKSQNQPQAALKAVTGSNKDAATFSLAKEDDRSKSNQNPDNPDLKALLKITDERKNEDPLLKSLVKSMSNTKDLAIDEPTVNVPLLSESSSSEAEKNRDDKNGAKRKRSKSRSKSRNKNRKSKK